MILYINACVRGDSRTDFLAKKLLKSLGDYEEIKLIDLGIKSVDAKALELRDSLLASGDLQNPAFALSRRFASADTIVIAAPYWDSSFPSVLKTYVENIYINGIVTKFSEDGRPIGLCKAEKLYYVTTAGGKYNKTFSYDYIAELAKVFFGIKETKLIFAEMLDIRGANVKEILDKVSIEP